MTTSGYLEDDELILYAMHALSKTEAQSVQDKLFHSHTLQRRLAGLQTTLGVYAEAVTECVEAPQGSLERLIAALPQQTTNVVAMPRVTAQAHQARVHSPGWTTAAAWAGWAVAAAALVTLGVEHRSKVVTDRTLQQQTAHLQEKIATADQLSREREDLQQTLQQAEQRTSTSQAELSTYKDQSAALSAKVAEESTRAQRESSRANDLASLAAEKAHESDRLRGTVASQQDQVAQLSTQAASARQVMDALSDPTALRVTLTVPKQKKTPSGRGTYVPTRGTLLFTASNMPSLRGNKVYELWLMPSDGSSPIPAGTFVPDAQGNATVVATNFQHSVAARGFAVTAEPVGGSQKPTLPILLAAS